MSVSEPFSREPAGELVRRSAAGAGMALEVDRTARLDGQACHLAQIRDRKRGSEIELGMRRRKIGERSRSLQLDSTRDQISRQELDRIFIYSDLRLHGEFGGRPQFRRSNARTAG